MRHFNLPLGGTAKLCARSRALAAAFMTGVSTLALFAAMPVRHAAAADCTVSSNIIYGQTDCTVTNSGELTSPEGGLTINQGSDGVTVNNEAGGIISGTGGWSGIKISVSDNTVINNAEGATISGEGSGSAGISVTDPDYSGSSPAGTIINNAGSIAGENAGIDLRYFYGASIVNQTTGSVEGGYGIYAYSSSGVLDIQNDGTITGDSNYGIYIANMVGANISNAGWIYGLNTGIDINGATEIAITNSGTISSNAHAIYAGSVDDFSLINSGTISSTGTDDLYYGVILDNVNLATIVNSGTISSSLAGQDRGLRLNEVENATIVNSGSILGGYFGIEFLGDDSAATITNTGTISGGVFGIWASDTDLTLSNAGTISGGVRSTYAESLNATNSGTIIGNFDLAALSEAIISNSGTISGGIFAGDVNTVDITNSGTISSDAYGVNVMYGTLSLLNSGTISGSADGVYVREASASIINSGTISGGDYGISADRLSLTITNIGTISGGTASILFSEDGNTLMFYRVPYSTVSWTITTPWTTRRISVRAAIRSVWPIMIRPTTRSI